MTKPFRILHVITSLNAGGAEGALFRLIQNTRSSHSHCVVCLIGSGSVGEKLEEIGVEVYYLNMPPGRLTLTGLKALNSHIRSEDKEKIVVQTWLYHADLLGGLLAKFARIQNICWGVRNNRVDSSAKMTLVVVYLCAALSWLVPKKIISCSIDAANYHRKLGYRDLFKVIPNGFDACNYVVPAGDVDAFRESVIDPECFLIGCIARWDPQKDHENLLRAFSHWLQGRSRGKVKLILVGLGCDSKNVNLRSLIESLNLTNFVTLLGHREDIPVILHALDLHVLSSKSEAFPNVLAEAMVCGTPCITTDVGDAAEIVSDTGWVVGAQDMHALAEALDRAYLKLNSSVFRTEIAERCRSRISSEYSLSSMTASFVTAWRH